MKQHAYQVQVTWTGNDGEGTKTYKTYRRDHTIASEGKPLIPGSSDPAFRGDRSRYNPEELLLGSLSSCHMLWYLHLCAVNAVVVLEYLDSAVGILEEAPNGSGEFTQVTLKPRVKVTRGTDRTKALALHSQAHEMCFIARSVKFHVNIEPEILEAH